MATISSEAAIVGVSSTDVTVETVGPAGGVVGVATVYPTGPGAPGVVDAGVAITDADARVVEYLLLTTAGSNQVELSSSTPGQAFSSPVPIGRFSSTVPGELGGLLGGTPTYVAGGEAGQLALASVGTELFALWTTNLSGTTVVETASSGNGGASWQGPYLTRAVPGTVLDPSLAVGPDGVVYATWWDPADRGGSAVEAAYFPDGFPMVTPALVPYSNATGSAPGSAPAIAVDGLARPLLLWAGAQPANGSSPLDYTGQYLPWNQTLSVISEGVNDPLLAPDFPHATGNPPAQATSLSANVSNDIEAVSSDLEEASRTAACSGQLVAGNSLYQNLTHLDLVDSVTTCGTTLTPNPRASPLTNVVGLDEPNTYLAVYGDWALESLGVGVTSSPLASVPTGEGPTLVGSTNAAFPSGASGSASYAVGVETVNVNPIPWTATAYEVTIGTSGLGVGKTSFGGVCSLSPRRPYSETFTWNTTQTEADISFSSPSGTYSSEFYGTTSYPSAVWPYDMTPGTTYSWTASFSAYITAKEMVFSSCTDSWTNSSYNGWVPTINLHGNLTASSGLSIGSPSGLATATYNSTDSGAVINIAFTTSLPSNTTTHLRNLAGPANAKPWWNATRGVSGAYTSPAYYVVGSSLNVTVSAASVAGGGASPGPAMYSVALGGSGYTPSAQLNASCQFTLSTSTTTPKVWPGTAGLIAGTGNGTATVAWYSSQPDVGFFAYGAYAEPQQTTVSNITPVRQSNGSYAYSIELHGLEVGQEYVGHFAVSWLGATGGCLSHVKESQNYTYVPALTIPELQRTDAPYDSITHTGGGENFTWLIPAWFKTTYPNAVFLNGTLTLDDLNNTAESFVDEFTSLPLPALSNSSGYTYDLNVTPTDRGAPYAAQLVLNYANGSGSSTILSWVSPAVTFTYLQDTSGDGLTDVEKADGWVLPLGPDPAVGRVNLPACAAAENKSNPDSYNKSLAQSCKLNPASIVTASVSSYATNGLVNDYIEKKFDLNPNVLDTSASHMLDTWNLTFDLGNLSKGSVKLPKQGFRFYYENSTYNFSLACQAFAMNGSCPVKSNASLSSEPTNLLWYPGVGSGWVGDSSSWAATVLWSSKNLPAFEKLINATEPGDWLRATTGTYDHHRTMTVWGKLSWGANPLAWSTSGDGIADGNQPDPLGPVIVQLDVTGWWVDHGLVSNDGVAPDLAVYHVNATNKSDNSSFFQGWAPSETGSSNDSYSGSFVVSVPIYTSFQYVSFRANLEANTSTGLMPLLNNTASGSPDLNTWHDGGRLDLAAVGSSAVYDVHQSLTTPPPSGQLELVGNLTMSATVLFDPGKARTFLVTPANNTTLSGLPWGLNRYTGETDFDLIVLNVSSSTTLHGIAGANGSKPWTYNLTFDQGLNNILVPRTLFNVSPLAQALLANNNESPTVPGGAGVTFTAADWSSRTETNNTTNPVPAQANGFNPNYIRVFSNLSELRNGSTNSVYGGVPNQPQTEAGVESRQVQAVFYANVSGNGYVPGDGSAPGFTSAAAELTDLVGGLVLGCTTNVTTGNWFGNVCSVGSKNTGWEVTGNVLDVTRAVHSLNLPSNVLRALAKFAVSSDGYPAPQYHAPPPAPNGWLTFAWDVWNTLTGIGQATGIAVLWNWATAAAAYVVGAFNALSKALGLPHLASQIVSGLRAVAGAIEWALSQVVAAVKMLIEDLLKPPLVAVQNALASLFQWVFAGYSTSNDSGGQVTAKAEADFIAGFLPLFISSLTIATVVAIAVTIALPVDVILGAIAVLIPVIIAWALGATVSLNAVPRPDLNFTSPQSILSSAAGAASAFLDPGCVGDNAATQTAVDAAMLGASSVIVASLLYFTDASVLTVTVSLTLSLLAMLFAVAAYDPLPGTPSSQVQQLVALAVLLAFLSFGADFLAFLQAVATLPQQLVLVAVSIGIDLGGLYLGTQVRNRSC